MKIGIIDNTCNTGYVLMRFLNDRGYDTDLIILGGVQDHADPENDTFNKQYFDKIIYAKFDQRGIRLTNEEIKAKLGGYDFLIGSDFAPALCYRINKQLDVFMPHGTDVFEYPFRSVNLLRFKKKNVGDWLFARWQNKGINKNTRYLLFDITNDVNERYVNHFSKAAFKRIMLSSPHIYYPQYEQLDLDMLAEKDASIKRLKMLKEQGFSIAFHHCQHVWKNRDNDLFNKGTDKIIYGYRQYLDKYPDSKLKLVLFARGRDYEFSLELVKELKLEDNIVWLPSMPRKHIMACLAFADIGIGELGHSWFSYNVVTEFMAMKLPIIHNCDVEYYKTIHPSVYPMYPAKTVEDVAQALCLYQSSPESFKQSGVAAYEWWRKNVADRTLDFMVQLIEDKR